MNERIPQLTSDCLESSTLASISFRNSDSIIRNAEWVDSPQSTQYIKTPVSVDKITLQLPLRQQSGIDTTKITNPDTYTEPTRPYWTVGLNQPDDRPTQEQCNEFAKLRIPMPAQSIPVQPILAPCNHLHSKELVCYPMVPNLRHSMPYYSRVTPSSFNLRRNATNYINRFINKFF